MKRRRKATINAMERGALDVLSEAIHSLRTAPLGVLAAYFAGGVPFILGLLYFWSDMSKSAFAAKRCFSASLGLAALFIWMKVWHAVFAGELKFHITGEPAPRWTAGRILRLAAIQTFFQPHGLLLIPFAMILLLPFYCVYTFFQNITLMGDGTSSNVVALARRAWRQALLWPKQNHILMWMVCPWVLGSGMLTVFGAAWCMLFISPEVFAGEGLMWFAIGLFLMFQVILPLAPFSCAVAGNVAVLIAFLPGILYGLLGVETTFTLTGVYSIFNTTFLMAVFGITYLCIDPIIKAAYVLRCFHGESLQTGADLMMELGTEGKDERH